MSEPGHPESVATGRSFGERLTGTLRLDSSVYDEIADDATSLGQAAGVVACAAAARAIGAAMIGTQGEAVVGAIGVFVFWPVAVVLIWGVGSWFGHPSSFARILRLVGFAMAPLLLVVLIVIPNQWVQTLVSLSSFALLFATLAVATRQGLRTDTGRAAFVCLVVAMIFVFVYFVAIYLVARAGGAA
jgi:Yip1 domain